MLRRVVLLLTFFSAGMVAWGQAQPRVGEVIRVVPDVTIERTGQSQAAQAQSAVHLEDTVATARFARARLRLDEGSLLNLGAESSLKITAHDATAQRSELELAVGRIRARVVRGARSGGFEVRTPTAVAGVVGTHYVVSVTADYTEVLCLEGEVIVRNADATVSGTVRLRAGEFTRVARGQPPAPAEQASPEQIERELERTDIAAGPFNWNRVEVSWPPAGCGEGMQLTVRAWVRETRGEQEVEMPLDTDLVSGTLAFGATQVQVEAGIGVLAAAPGQLPDGGRFMPRGAGTEVAVKVWEPKKVGEGEGWRSPRAAFIGSAFYVLGPVGPGAYPQFDFRGQPAQLLWSGPCGAGFLAPQAEGGEYEVTLRVNGRAVAVGRMNLIRVNYRVAMPPVVGRGQTSHFGVDLIGLQNLAQHAAGRPVITGRIVNTTPAILGNLQTKTKGARAAGETILFAVGATNVAAGGMARVDGSGKGRVQGTFVLKVDMELDPELEEPRTPMAPAAGG